MVLLALAFPKVRFIWSPSPYQTAEIFEELKVRFLSPSLLSCGCCGTVMLNVNVQKGQEEPDPDKAVSIGLEEGEEAGGNHNQTPQVYIYRLRYPPPFRWRLSPEADIMTRICYEPCQGSHQRTTDT